MATFSRLTSHTTSELNDADSSSGSSSEGSRCLDCANDLVVAGAAAKIVRETEADFVFGRVWISVEQSFGCDEKAGDADAALQSGSFQKTLLQWMQVAMCSHSFHRFQPHAFGFHGQHQATIHRDAVQEDGASAAIAVVATLFRPGQPQLIPQDFEQTLP